MKDVGSMVVPVTNALLLLQVSILKIDVHVLKKNI